MVSRIGEYELTLKFWYYEPYVKNNVGRDRRTNVVISECFICQWEGSEVVRLKRWESGEVGRREVPGFNQGCGMQGESKTSSFCFWGVKESMELLELQCTFMGGFQLGGSHAEKRGDNRQKFFTSNSVEALILFNEEHRDLSKLQVLLGWEWWRIEWGGKGGAISKRGDGGAGSC